jgi:ABC-type transport system involved in multi-copper enzyme maturation permease subunit
MIAVVRLTLFEAVRRRTLWALALLTGAIVVLTGLGFEWLVSSARAAASTTELQIQIGVSQVLIFCAFMFSFILATTAAFLGAPAVASDVESGVLQAMLARPLARSSLIVGRWVGLAFVVVGYAVAAGLLEIGALRLVSGYGPPDPLGAVAALAGEGVIVMTVALLLSTRLPTIAAGATAIVLFGLSWGVGVLGGVASALGVPSLGVAGTVGRLVFPSDGLWRATIFSLEPPILIATIAAGRPFRVLEANPFFASTGPDPLYLAWCAAWLAGVVGLAIVSFGRREL